VFSLIFQKSIPYDTTYPKLPGTRPISPDEWIICDDAFSQQMALRDELIETKRDKVLAISDQANEAAVELSKMALEFSIKSLGYQKSNDEVIRPDEVSIKIDLSDPMRFLGRLVQNDFCILQKVGDEHVLTAASLCFPASWSLEEKFLKPLIDIHIPVKEYNEEIAKRVQRLFDGLQVSRPVWRFNALYYEEPDLFQPRSVNQPRKKPAPNQVNYFRSERQTLIKLPETRAIVFGIHTFVIKIQNLEKD
jgi:hypothetical protein|tara:strand:+ start:420 stop:1166 length:747 start_codon:yes stop_codon:yes gene_type:complete